MKKKVKKIPKFKDGGLTWKDMSKDQRWNAGIEAVGAIGNTIGTAMSGQDVTLGGAISSAGSLAATGFKIGGPIGAGVGAAAGLIAGTAGRKNSVNENSTSTSVADIAEEGSGWMKWFGMSEEEMMAKANRIANANISEQMTEQIRSKYAMNPNNPNGGTILAAEGGIIPNDEILVGVTAGEVYKDSNTGEWGVVKGKGMHSKKPKKDDAETMLIPKKSIILNTHPDYVFAEFGDKTPAQIMKPLAKPIKTTGKYAEGTKAAVDAVGKKLLRKQELRKQELHQGQIKNKYSKGGITNYDDIVNQKYEEVDDTLNVLIPPLKINPRRSKLEEELFKPKTPEITGKDRRWVYHLAKAGETMSDYLPMASALLKDYDYQRVQPRIGRNHNIPVDYNINDILVDNQQAHAINNYNISQMGGSTGAYLAAASQSASNLAKANSKARIYQKNKQNELIARNIAQLNDWERYANNQLWAADVATAQNQGMAQQMRDQAIKDAYEYQTGRRNDRWKLSMLEPLFKYAVDDNIWKNFKIA